MNTTKLNAVKAALRLTVDLAEKQERKGFPYGEDDFRDSETTGETWMPGCAAYLAQAANMSPSMAKALLQVIEQQESSLNWYSLNNPAYHEAEECIEKILAEFPDNP